MGFHATLNKSDFYDLWLTKRSRAGYSIGISNKNDDHEGSFSLAL